VRRFKIERNLAAPYFDKGTFLRPRRHGEINCAIKQSAESGDSNLSKMARDARAASEIHPNLGEH
jgi:hypothetical protein